ncbi:hypothetical protein MHSWG343_05350 [Candidatus Mycoplasma haematohominis]|uniref:Uncharacterized protein n=1 Tax=Candidatus Mycoplasma haematohominis TaxID=1494318 RepID=A0A478FPV6_9MOLU|nr:hypothetical protein MHSWG343_05350 [Candidatus Mycoplasma haemohominis]
MSVLVKVGVGVGILTLVTGGGFYIKTLLGEEISFVTLIAEKDYEKTYTENTIGKLYGDYLVAPFGLSKNDGNVDKSKDNKSWWEISYRNFETDGASSDDFKKVEKVDKSFVDKDSQDNKSLNKVCETVYKKASTEVDVTEPAKETPQSKLRKDLFKYCSFLGKEPTTISNKEKEKKTYLDVQSYGATQASKLVSVTDNGNYLFWVTQTKLFFEAKGDRSGSKDTDSKSIFKKLFDENKDKNKSWDLVKNACKTAYSKKGEDSAATDKAPKESVFRYCSLKGKE